MSTTTTLDPQQRALVVALASGLSHDAAGDLVGISGRTVRRRLAADPALRDAVQAQRDENACMIADLLVAQAAQAVERLARIIDQGTDRDAVSACRAVLAEARQHRETTVTSERLRDVLDLLHNRTRETA
jgi:hypothetical protein